MFIWKVFAQKTVTMTDVKFLKSERKIAPVHAMEAYGGSGCLNPLIHNLCTRWRWMISFTFRLLNTCVCGGANIELYINYQLDALIIIYS